jgi:general stress protein YciG
MNDQATDRTFDPLLNAGFIESAPRKRGFAALPPERRRVIASQGGQTAHTRGTAHKFNSDEARIAGRRGGIAVSQDIGHMAAIGRRGGLAKAQNGLAHDGSAFAQAARAV